MVFDAVGGPLFEPLTAAMSRGGLLIEYGGLSPEPTRFPLFAVLSKTPAKAFIIEGLVSGSLQPIIARTFPFDEIVEVHRFLESNEQFGKIVVTV